MGTVVAVVEWVVEVALSVALVGAIGVTLGFSSESYKSGMLPLHRALNALALLLAGCPFALTLWVGYRHFLSSRPEDIPLGLALPLVVGVGCGAASLLAIFTGAKLSGVGAEAHARRIKTLVSKKVAAGQLEFAAQVVVMNPASTAADMQRCRAYIESRSNSQDRWLAFRPFIERGIGWKTWNPREVGLSPFWDSHVALAVVRHEQEWFLRTFFESMLGYRPTLPDEEVRLLQGTLRQLEPAAGWSLAAIEPLRARILPELLRRLEPRPGYPLEGDPAVLAEIRERLAALIATGPRVPPAPPSLEPALAPDGIGVVHRAEDDSLEFWMRATATEGHPGDVYFRHAPGSQDHTQWMDLLGLLLRGQVRPVPRLKATGAA